MLRGPGEFIGRVCSNSKRGGRKGEERKGKEPGGNARTNENDGCQPRRRDETEQQAKSVVSALDWAKLEQRSHKKG